MRVFKPRRPHLKTSDSPPLRSRIITSSPRPAPMPDYLEFNISLQHIKPKIWRRLQLPTTATFGDLHRAIQAAFDWHSMHLWEFRSPGRRAETIAGVPEDFGFDDPAPDADRVALSTYFEGDHKRHCNYIYDFGDDWAHRVDFVGTRTDAARFRCRLLAGERAAPLEDCGGIPGYERMVEFVTTGQDPHDDAGELAEWIGEWRPDAFDLADAQLRCNA